MRFLLVSVSGDVSPKPVEIRTLGELLAYLNFQGEENDLIISRRSIVDMSHDRKQTKGGCSHVLCLYDDFVEPPRPSPRSRARLRKDHSTEEDSDD